MNSKNTKIIIVIAVVSVCLLSALAVVTYNFIILPELIATSINKNVDNLNSNTEESKKILTSLDKSISESQANQDNKTLKNLEQINIKNKELEQLAKKTTDLTKQLDRGPNKDTEKFYNTSIDILNKRKETLSVLTKSIDNQSCVVQIINNFTEKFSNAQTNLGKINDINILESSNFAKQAGQDIEDGAKKLTELKSCFLGDFAKYYTNELQLDVDKEVKIYNDLAILIRNLASGIEQNNIPKINEASNKIETLSKQPRLLFEGQNLKKAIEDPAKEFNLVALKELEDQNKQTDTIFKEIKQKYNLSEK